MPLGFEFRHSPPFGKPLADAQMSASSSYMFFHSRENILSTGNEIGGKERGKERGKIVTRNAQKKAARGNKCWYRDNISYRG